MSFKYIIIATSPFVPQEFGSSGSFRNSQNNIFLISNDQNNKPVFAFLDLMQQFTITINKAR